MNLYPDEEDDAKKENNEDPRQEVETVTSKNDNMEPVPDHEKQDEKKK
jgi:hypothetical protein